MTVRVTRADMDADGDSLTVQVTIERGRVIRTLDSPRASDVPQDIREALAAWLAWNQA